MRMEWKLSDGTTVSLGGRVSGDSPLAEYMRELMTDARNGDICSGYGPCPHYETLDVNVPHLLDYWMRQNYSVASGPSVEYPVAKPRSAPPPGAVY